MDAIEDRIEDLEDQHSMNLMWCVWVQSPDCVLGSMIANDYRLNQLEDNLEAAQARQAQVIEQIAQYEARRDRIRGEIDDVRAHRDALIALYLDHDPGVYLPDVLTPGSELADAYSRVAIVQDLAVATQSEIAALEELRAAAVELGHLLDGALAEVRALKTSTDALVEDSRSFFQDMLKASLTGNVHAVAADFLDEAVADATRHMLADLHWPVGRFVDHLLAGDPAAIGALRHELLEALTLSTATTWSNDVDVAIVDHTRASSAIDMTSELPVTRVEVSVDIEHTYIGDLTVDLVDPSGMEHRLHARTGGSTDDLQLDVVLDAVPAQPRGIWRLWVHDGAAADEGWLRSVTLVMYHPPAGL